MHVGGGEVPEALTVEGKQLAREQRVTYLGSVQDAIWDPSSAVRANAQRAKRQIIRVGTLLKSSEVHKQCKAACIEAFVKPTLLYGLETIVLRVTDDRKLSAVFKTAKRMAMGSRSRREKTVQELIDAIPTISIAAQLQSRRLKLWMSACSNSGLTKRLCQSDRQKAGGDRPVQQRNWITNSEQMQRKYLERSQPRENGLKIHLQHG